MVIDPAVLPLFLMSACMVMIAPGADMVFIVANSVSGGKRSGGIAALGIASGAFLHFVAGAVGLSAIILTSELAYDVIRWLGAGYLAWVGYQYLTTRPTAGSVPVLARRSALQVYRQGILTNLLNPKAILFNLSFVPQFVAIGYGAAWAQVLVLGMMLITIGLVINLLIVILSNRLSSLLGRSQLSFQYHFGRAAGVVLIGLAIWLAASRRQA